MTHFFAGNLHAIDFRCPVGTPLLAVGSGTVISVRVDANDVTGIAASNLFRWNAILIRLDKVDEEETSGHRLLSERDVLEDDDDGITVAAGPLFVEYVHVQSSSVSVGDRVESGQVIGESGEAGFCPEPHLHLACYRSDDDDAATCRFYFASTLDGGGVFLPRAGRWYSSEGEVEAPTSAATGTAG